MRYRIVAWLLICAALLTLNTDIASVLVGPRPVRLGILVAEPTVLGEIPWPMPLYFVGQEPVWSSDGQMIVLEDHTNDTLQLFSVATNTALTIDLRQSVSKDTGDDSLVSTGVIGRIAWHPHKNWLAVCATSGIWLFDATGNVLDQVTDMYVHDCAWHPQNDTLAVVANPNDAKNVLIAIVDLEGQTIDAVHSLEDIPGSIALFPGVSWITPTILAFGTHGSGIIRYDLRTDSMQTLTASAGVPQSITHPSNADYFISIHQLDHSTAIYQWNLDGSLRRRMTLTGVDPLDQVAMLACAPGGEYCLFATAKGVAVINAQGQTIATLPPLDTHVAWHPSAYVLLEQTKAGLRFWQMPPPKPSGR